MKYTLDMTIDPKLIRETAGKTLSEVNERMGYAGRGQAINKIEQVPDWKVSTIARFIEACDGEAVLTVHVGEKVLTFPL